MMSIAGIEVDPAVWRGNGKPETEAGLCFAEDAPKKIIAE